MTKQKTQAAQLRKRIAHDEEVVEVIKAVFHAASGIALRKVEVTAAVAHQQLAEAYELLRGVVEDLDVWELGKTKQWKVVARAGDKLAALAIVARREREASLKQDRMALARLEAELQREAAAVAAPAAKKAELVYTKEDAFRPARPPRKTHRLKAEDNPLTHELLEIAATAEGLDFAEEARERSMTYDAVNAPVWHYARRNPAGLVKVRGFEGSRRCRYFTRAAWKKFHAATHPDAEVEAWPKDCYEATTKKADGAAA